MALFTRLLALALALAALPSAFSPPAALEQQTGAVEGRVVNAETGQAVPGVNVALEGTSRGTATGAEGRFAITGATPGAYTLVASSVGYERFRTAATVRAGEATHVEVALTPDVAELAPVVVTGEKVQRAQAATYSSVSVLGAEAVGNAGLNDLEDAFRLAANVRDADFIDSGFLIRGINSEGVAGPSGNPLATVYVDGVAQTQNGARRGALGMWDVEQVEIWKGPQSTLSGRNALAGKIELQTKDPTMTWEAAAQGEYGNRSRNQQAAMLSGPVVDDKLAFRISAERRHADGEVDYPLYDGFERLGERAEDDYRQVRGKLLYLPAGAGGLRALLTLSSSYDSPAYADVDGPSADPSAAEDVSGAVEYHDRVWGLQSLPVFTEARSTQSDQASLALSLPLSPAWTLHSTSTLLNTVTNRGSVDLSSTGEIDEVERSQELRAVYDGSTLELVAGAYALDGDFNDDRDQRRSFEDFRRQTRRDGSFTNLAGFGEARVTVLPGLTLIGGARYDWEMQDFSTVNRQFDVATDTLRSESSSGTEATFGAFLPKAGVAYAFSPAASVAFTVQRAYRAGGSAINGLTDEPYDYDPEQAWNYELSLQGQAMERLRYGLNLFYLDWRDQQVNVPQVPGDFTSDLILQRRALDGARPGGDARRAGRARPPRLRLARHCPDGVRGVQLRAVRAAPRPRRRAVPAGAGRERGRRRRIRGRPRVVRRRGRELHGRGALALAPRRRTARRAFGLHARQPASRLARGSVFRQGVSGECF